VTEPGRALFVPVLIGTVRQGRMSLPVARLVVSELSRRPGIETELIDIARLPLPIDDAGQAIKDPTFSAQMSRADALVVVSPEYNHGYSGLLKHALDSCLKEYVHKAVGVVGVSAGPCCASSGWSRSSGTSTSPPCRASSTRTGRCAIGPTSRASTSS